MRQLGKWPMLLANYERLKEAFSLFKSIFQEDENWMEITRRLIPSGLLDISEKELELIVKK